MKKKHRHKKHRSQENERGKEGGETVPSSRNLDMEKQSSNGTCSFFQNSKLGKIEQNKQHYSKVLLNSFPINGYT